MEAPTQKSSSLHGSHHHIHPCTPPCSSTPSHRAASQAPLIKMKRKASEIPGTMLHRWSKAPLSCSLCRQKKLRCDRAHPCSNCTQRKATCVYAREDASRNGSIALNSTSSGQLHNVAAPALGSTHDQVRIPSLALPCQRLTHSSRRRRI